MIIDCKELTLDDVLSKEGYLYTALKAGLRVTLYDTDLAERGYLTPFYAANDDREFTFGSERVFAASGYCVDEI